MFCDKKGLDILKFNNTGQGIGHEVSTDPNYDPNAFYVNKLG